MVRINPPHKRRGFRPKVSATISSKVILQAVLALVLPFQYFILIHNVYTQAFLKDSKSETPPELPLPTVLHASKPVPLPASLQVSKPFPLPAALGLEASKPFPKEKVTKILLVLPWGGYESGGPEAIHQLCHEINTIAAALPSPSDNSNVSACLLYARRKRTGRILHQTKAYPPSAYLSSYPNLTVCTSDDFRERTTTSNSSSVVSDPPPKDNYSSSLLVWPEIWTECIDHLEGNQQNAIHWLSVDKNYGRFTQWKRGDILHLYQSEYAKSYIMQNMKEARADLVGDSFNPKQVLPLTEYIPQIETHEDFRDLPKDLDIVYNPKKGKDKTRAIRKRSGHEFGFVPIGGDDPLSRLTPRQVTQLLHRAKIYIDFGEHPGMDRLPREAALANCIVITNKEGAAFYQKDIPIPEHYKFDTFDVENIHNLLEESIGEYEEKTKDFDLYREWILGQKGAMESCIKGLISTICTER